MKKEDEEKIQMQQILAYLILFKKKDTASIKTTNI